jgi:hypothetical protein
MNQRAEPGSVGIVETWFVDRPEPLPLVSGAVLGDLRPAY